MKVMNKLIDNWKILVAVLALIIVTGGCIWYYAAPKITKETGTYTQKENAIVAEVTDYLVQYVVTDGFEHPVDEAVNSKEVMAQMIADGEVILLDEMQIDDIAQYAADHYDTIIGSNIGTLTDEQMKELEKNIRNNIIVTIGDDTAEEADVNTITGGVSAIVIQNILMQLDQMNESIAQLQKDLNTIKENIALGTSFDDIAESIGKLGDRLEYVKDNLSEEDLNLSSDITSIEEDLRTLNVNVDETATVIVKLESTMDNLTKNNFESVALQLGDMVGAIDKIKKEFQSILDRINNLQSSMSSKDSELTIIVKEAADKVADLSGLISALQKELNNYKAATDKAIKNMQDTQLALDKNLSAYKNTTDKSLGNLQGVQTELDKNLSSYKNTTDKSLGNLQGDHNKLDQNVASYKNTTDESLGNLKSGQETANKNFGDYKELTTADIINLYSLIENIKIDNETQVVDLTEIKKKLSELDEGLTQCFTSVSSGKRILASALTDKGIQTDAASEFQLLATNISKIGDQSNVVSASMLQGFVAYTGNGYVTGNMPNVDAVSVALNCGQSFDVPLGYHNGSGKVTANTLASQTQATAIAGNLSQGVTAWVNGRIVTGTGADVNEAYNKGYADGMNDALNGAGISYIYHVHGGNNTGGGCYTIPVYHVHNAGCTTTNRCSCSGYSQGDYEGDHAIDGWPIYKCTNCPHHSYDHTDGKCKISSSSNACGKTENSIDYYDLGCGKTTSTIESATIVF